MMASRYCCWLKYFAPLSKWRAFRAYG